jgi:hypothetical protein
MPDDTQGRALECCRLASDCMQLAGDAPDPDLKAHFLRMAQEWAMLADRDPGVAVETSDRAG